MNLSEQETSTKCLMGVIHNSPQTKLDWLKRTKLNLASVWDYLQSPEFTASQKKLLFRLGSKTLDVKANFPGLHSNNLCISCGLFPETQTHLLQCSVLTSKLQYLCGKTSSLCEDDIYGPTERQKVIVNIYTDILNAREQLHPSDEGPVHTVIV